MPHSTRQPKALPFLFLTEMWERFGFYVVQAMLVLYMTQAYGFSDDQSYMIAGVFAALAYISPLLGGFIADNLLGFKTSIAWGGIFLSLGYALLALTDRQGLDAALATIIIGTGLFKPSISSLLGTLYGPNDSTRDAGFTLFYVGINLGALLAGVSSGAIKNHFGWHAGFALASVGLVIGLGIFTLGVRICRLDYQPDLKFANKHFLLHKPFLLFYLLLVIVLISNLLQSALLSQWLLPVMGVFLIFFIFYLACKQEKFYRDRLILLNVLSISSVIYWMFYLQMFLANDLFIDRLVDKSIFGFEIPTTVFYTFESAFVILLGPVFAWGWQTLDQHQHNPSPISKFIFAILLAGLCFAVLGASTYFTNNTGLIHPAWIVFAYLLLTIGELLLSPIGLSAVTLLSPPKLTGLMMGIWFVALGFGGEFGGMLAKLASVSPSITDPLQQLEIYRVAFFKFAGIALSVSFVLFALRFIKKLTC